VTMPGALHLTETPGMSYLLPLLRDRIRWTGVPLPARVQRGGFVLPVGSRTLIGDTVVFYPTRPIRLLWHPSLDSLHAFRSTMIVAATRSVCQFIQVFKVQVQVEVCWGQIRIIFVPIAKIPLVTPIMMMPQSVPFDVIPMPVAMIPKRKAMLISLPRVLDGSGVEEVQKSLLPLALFTFLLLRHGNPHLKLPLPLQSLEPLLSLEPLSSEPFRMTFFICYMPMA